MRGTYTASSVEVSWWLRIWRSPELLVARFVLWNYLRAGWILGDIVYIWFLYAFLFLEFGGDVAYFYGTTNQGLYILAVLDTIVMVQRSLKSARIYLPLTRLPSRASYMWGLIIATSVLRVPLFLLMLLLGGGYHRHIPILGIVGATPWNMLPGALGLIINSIIICLLTIVLSTPIATRRIQFGFLLWLAATLYSTTTGWGASYLWLTQIPLEPFRACFQLGLNSTLDGNEVLMVLLSLGYIAILSWLISFLIRQRDLVLF